MDGSQFDAIVGNAARLTTRASPGSLLAAFAAALSASAQVQTELCLPNVQRCRKNPDSLDAATEHARNCPHLDVGGRVDVYETFEVMQRVAVHEERASTPPVRGHGTNWRLTPPTPSPRPDANARRYR